MIAHKMINPNNRIQNIKNIILVSSGKGGVGKSTVALNLALSLQKKDLKIGILDADIYGPSLPTLIEEVDHKLEVEQDNFLPLEKFGIKHMSFGFLIDPKKAAIWRGAIVVKAIKQMLYDTIWGDIDILVVDMPPGTGDIHLSIAQHFPITANITVTTPNILSLSDVIRSDEMYRKFNIPCLGFIQNMAYYICQKCGSKDYVFGCDSAMQVLKSEYSLKHLGDIPLGLIANQESYYDSITKTILDDLAKYPKANKAIIPPVVSI
jgi:ATP-binding protein involved in chromosome partitioning